LAWPLFFTAGCARNPKPRTVPRGDIPRAPACASASGPLATVPARGHPRHPHPPARILGPRPEAIVRDGPQVHPGASPEVPAPSAYQAVLRCAVLPVPARSRFGVLKSALAGFRRAAFAARVAVHRSASLCDLPPFPRPASPGPAHRSTAAQATQVIHRRFLRGRCSRPAVAVGTALPQATRPRRRSWGSALRSVAPARRSQRVSAPLNPPAVS
jgi:hypothetical protein